MGDCIEIVEEREIQMSVSQKMETPGGPGGPGSPVGHQSLEDH